MAQENPTEYDYHKESGELAAMQAGKDDQKTLDAWQVGELAYAELGAEGNGSFSGYDLFGLGGIPDEYHKTGEAKVSGNIQAADDGDSDTDPEDVKKGAQIRVRLTDYSHTETIAKSRWIDVKQVEQTSIENQPLLKFAGIDDAEFAKQGRHVVVEYRNKRFTSSAKYGVSTLAFPFVGARDSVGN